MYPSTFYSQIGQDEYYIKNIIHYREDGYYVDVGAHDGIKFSNTFYLEKHLNWKGVCIEANESLHKKLCIHRPHSINVNSLVYNESNLCLNLEIPLNAEIKEGNDMLSRISNEEMNVINQGYFNEQFVTSSFVPLKSRTLTDILDDNNAPTIIDYLSIDIEGAELACLQGIDFNKYIFLFMTVEYGNREDFKNKIINFLSKKNYVVHRINRFDIEFVYTMVVTTAYNL